MDREHEYNIRQIQRALRILHKNGEDIPPVYEDGTFDEATERGVIAFQALYTLPQTGIVDYDTWVLLMQKANEYVRKNREPFPIFPYVSDEESSVLPEEEGKTIWFLQAMLISLAEKYIGFDEVQLTGKNDTPTKNAIEYIHARTEDEHGAEALKRETWNSVARFFNAV